MSVTGIRNNGHYEHNVLLPVTSRAEFDIDTPLLFLRFLRGVFCIKSSWLGACCADLVLLRVDSFVGRSNMLFEFADNTCARIKQLFTTLLYTAQRKGVVAAEPRRFDDQSSNHLDLRRFCPWAAKEEPRLDRLLLQLQAFKLFRMCCTI